MMKVPCVACGETSRPHFGGGKCRLCYMRAYRVGHLDSIRASARKYANRVNAEKRDKTHFDGNREQALDRDGHKCVRCSSTNQLTVHHKDRSGRGADEHNNDLENLETLCRKCHAAEHRDELNAAREAARPNTCKNGHPKMEPFSRWTGLQWSCRVCAKLRARGYKAAKQKAQQA